MLVDQWRVLHGRELVIVIVKGVRAGGSRLARVLTHLDRPTDPEEYGDSYFWTRFAETGREIVSKPRERDESCLGLLHPRFDSQRLPYLVLADEGGVGSRVRSISRFAWGSVRCVRGEDGGFDRLERAGERFGGEAGCLLCDFLSDVCIASTDTFRGIKAR